MQQMIQRFCLLGVATILAGAATATSIPGEKFGFSAQEIGQIAALAQRSTDGASILNMILVPPVDSWTGALVLISKDLRSWQVAVVAYGARGFSTESVSPVLTSPFEVVGSAADMKEIFPGEGSAVEFHGCASHVCPAVFGIYLHVLGTKKDFRVKVHYKEVEYSPGLLAPENKTYKEWLDKEIAYYRSFDLDPKLQEQ
jgi:hypothetical protein